MQRPLWCSMTTPTAWHITSWRTSSTRTSVLRTLEPSFWESRSQPVIPTSKRMGWLPPRWCGFNYLPSRTKGQISQTTNPTKRDLTVGICVNAAFRVPSQPEHLAHSLGHGLTRCKADAFCAPEWGQECWNFEGKSLCFFLSGLENFWGGLTH